MPRKADRPSARARWREVDTSWRFFLSTLVGAWFTKQAYRPVAFPRARGGPSFFAGWLTNELALHHVAWQLFATGHHVRRGALKHWPGWLGLVSALAQLGLNYNLFKRAQEAEPVLRAAVRDALGEPGLGEVRMEEVRSLRGRKLVVPLPPIDGRVHRRRNVVFATHGGKDLKLDVYTPKPGVGERVNWASNRRPVMLYIHGGAWTISNKDEQGFPLMQELAARGWVGVNANYRLSPRATFPDHLIDIKAAIAWVREHADELGADPDFIVISGGSAGGHLAALAAVTPNDQRYQPGFEDADTSVQACVPLYGIYDFLDRDDHVGYTEWELFLTRVVMKRSPAEDPQLWHDASPIDWIDGDEPPFLIIHGEHDTLAPPAGARMMAELLEKVGSPVGLAMLPGAQHAFDVFASIRTAHTLDAIVEFTERLHARARSVEQAQPLAAG